MQGGWEGQEEAVKVVPKPSGGLNKNLAVLGLSSLLYS